jgi:hypothetical protein
MDAPTFIGARRVAPNTTTFRGFYPLGPMGILPANAHLIHAKEPVLVDTSGVALREPFLNALAEEIDPADLKWIFLSHTDLDHVGNLEQVMEMAPQAKVVIAGLGSAKLSLRESFDMSRIHVLEAGERLNLGDRELVAIKPPIYDAPETIGFFDTKTRVLFSADAFGALMEAPHEELAAVPEQQLRDGMAIWSGVDAPWLGIVDKQAFGHLLSDIQRLDPSAIISGHLPVASPDMTSTLLGNIMAAVSGGRIAAPDRETVEGIMAAADAEYA